MAQGVQWPFIRRMLPGMFQVFPVMSNVKFGTGGTTIGDTTTTSIYVGAPKRLVEVIGACVGGPTAALSAGGTVKAQLIRYSVAAAADVALTASTSIEADVITGTGNFYWAITGTPAQCVLNPGASTSALGDLLRWDVVTTSTVGTQPVLVATVEYNVIQ